MAKASLFSRVRGRLRAFGSDESGNIAVIFATAIIPVIGFTGVAVDYSRANSAKAAMQAATDAAGLILSKEAQKLSDADLKIKALDYFMANFNRPDITNIVVTPTFTSPASGNYQLNLVSAGTIKTTFTSIWQPTVAIGADSLIVWGMKKLELALALDNTGSMDSNNKMTQLKAAAKDLLKTLETAAKKPDDIKVAIIPFATDVNMGTGNVAATWIRWGQWNNANGTCSVGWNNNTKTKCENDGGTWTSSAHSTWNGCVWDRDQEHDVSNTATSVDIAATKYAAHQAGNCPVAMLPLTSTWTTLNSKIDAMIPVGNTNVTIGLQVAFQTLSPVSPFNASAPKTDLDKVIILLTDGDNTQNRWTSDQTEIDKRTKKACDNVKAANIQLYTVRVINGNANLLKNCATKPDMYYDVQNAAQLSAVFSQIAKNLANLRLAK
jgi:Flp pilus assembly protein TadG